MRTVLLFLIFLSVVLAVAGCTAVGLQRHFIYYPHAGGVAPNYPGIAVEHIRTEDNETLIGWYLAPKVENGVRGPVFLYFDGNAGHPDAWGRRYENVEAGGAGILYVCYRGYFGSTGHPNEAGLYADARAGYDWLVAQGYTASDIVIDGYSLGSGPAVHLASERPARALILEAPYTGVDDVARGVVGPFSALVFDRFASRAVVGKVHMPVLVVHGDRDSVVPFAQGQRLYALANEPKQFVAMPGSTHASLVADGAYDHIWPFLAAHPAR